MDEIKKRIEKAVDENELLALGFLSKYFHTCPFKGDILSDMLFRRLEYAPIEVKNDFIDLVCGTDDNMYGLRVCSTCGKFITEGYYLAGEYACSDECAIENYMHSSYNHSENGEVDREYAAKLFAEDLRLDEDTDAGEVYWTSWEI